MSLRRTFEGSAVESVDDILDDIYPRDQRDLDHEIARSTGESLSDIRRHGFSPLRKSVLELEPDDLIEDLIVDWDALELARNVQLSFAAA